jgi:hypothetical protein
MIGMPWALRHFCKSSVVHCIDKLLASQVDEEMIIGIFNDCDVLADATHPNISTLGIGGSEIHTTTLERAEIEPPKAVMVKILGLFGTNKLAGIKILGPDIEAST